MSYPDGKSEIFTYDPVGNRIHLEGAGTTPTDYTYGPANRLLFSEYAVETNLYTFDDAGRLIAQAVNDQTRTYAYDFQSRMTSLTDTNGSVFTYAFDGEGNRISQNLNDCLTTRFVYDGADVVMEVNSNNQVIWAWVNAPGLDQPVERIAFINGTPRTRQVFHADGLGSIAALTDESDATIQTYAYEAFGSIRIRTGTDLNRITYTAREAMGDSLGFFYYRHRIYDPHTGRFTSEDPLAFVDGANFYIYVGNNPVSFLDPDGLRIKLIGTPQEQAELLAVLQSFIRGTLTSDEEGYVSRAPCGQDEKYESTIDTLITSKNIYYVLFGDATLYGGGYFSPSGFNEGGSIVLSSDIGGTYVGWKGCSLVNDTRTMASVLAHELGHAITHVKKFHHADRRLPSGDPRKQKLENRAWRYSKTPYKRLNKSIPAK